MSQPRPVGHISSDRLLSRQAETYEAKIQAMGELLESEKRLALETQVGGASTRSDGGRFRWVGGLVSGSTYHRGPAAHPSPRPPAPKTPEP